jgi:hypothetical protein
MKKIFNWKLGWALVLFAILDIFCTGAGMGVPFFNIMLGLPVGVYLALRLSDKVSDTRSLMGKLLLWSAITSAFTVLLMVIIWLPAILMLFDPTADLANFGIPMILFEPLASFIGWLVLMILISPFLQMLMTLFGAQVTLWLAKPKPAAPVQTSLPDPAHG